MDPLTARILALTEQDCRAALLQLAADNPLTVTHVLDRVAASHARRNDE